MKRVLSRVVSGFWLFAGVCAMAHSGQEVSVGRIDLLLPVDGWKAYSLPDRGTTVVGVGVTHGQETEMKVLVRRGTDQSIEAALIVRANVSGKGRFSGVTFPNKRCDGGSGAFSEGDEPGSAPRSFRCLRILSPRDVTAPGGVHSNIKELLAKEGWTWPSLMQVVMSDQYAFTGAFVSMTALIRPESVPLLADRPQDMPAALPHGVSLSSVQWGRQLQKAVTASVYSIGGNLPVPALVLSDAMESGRSTTSP
jgi:hypothetical protein